VYCTATTLQNHRVVSHRPRRIAVRNNSDSQKKTILIFAGKGFLLKKGFWFDTKYIYFFSQADYLKIVWSIE
jgi:hypothetical protein